MHIINNGVLFDLDGTLWEVTDRTYGVVNEITKKYNLDEVTKDQVKNGFGKNSKDCSKIYFPNIDDSHALELLEESSTLNHQRLKELGGNVYDGLEEVLKELKKNNKLFIISNTSHKEYIEAFLISSGLGKYFDDYIASGGPNNSKGDAIKNVVSKYNLKKAVYVGDTLKALEAANFANIPFIYAKYGFGNLNTDYYINDIKELPSIIEKLWNN